MMVQTRDPIKNFHLSGTGGMAGATRLSYYNVMHNFYIRIKYVSMNIEAIKTHNP